MPSSADRTYKTNTVMKFNIAKSLIDVKSENTVGATSHTSKNGGQQVQITRQFTTEKKNFTN